MTVLIKKHPKPRPEVDNLPQVAHGALDYDELAMLELAPDNLIDFSANYNPYGPSPAVYEAIREVPLDRYPDREALALREALAIQHGISLGQLVVGNGSSELLWLLALAFLSPDARVLILGPTYGEYEKTAALMGARATILRANPAKGFQLNYEVVEIALRKIMPKMVFLCRPNNPTGQALPLELLAGWANAYSGSLFVVDEAYLAFAPELESAQSLGLPNILLLRSMTKDHALAGLRLGYLLGDERLISYIARVRPPWNVNAMAQAAGLAALGDQEHVNESMHKLQAAKAEMVATLQDLGFQPVESLAHLFLLRVGDAAEFRRQLIPQGVLVRDCSSFGLPGYVRIGTRRPEENLALVEAIRALDWRAN